VWRLEEGYSLQFNGGASQRELIQASIKLPSMAPLAAARSAISSIGQRRWLDQRRRWWHILCYRGSLARHTGNAPDASLRPCVLWQGRHGYVRAPLDAAHLHANTTQRRAVEGQPWRLLRVAHPANTKKRPRRGLRAEAARVGTPAGWTMERWARPSLSRPPSSGSKSTESGQLFPKLRLCPILKASSSSLRPARARPAVRRRGPLPLRPLRPRPLHQDLGAASCCPWSPRDSSRSTWWKIPRGCVGSCCCSSGVDPGGFYPFCCHSACKTLTPLAGGSVDRSD